jgi:hypothetical protein
MPAQAYLKLTNKLEAICQENSLSLDTIVGKRCDVGGGDICWDIG